MKKRILSILLVLVLACSPLTAQAAKGGSASSGVTYKGEASQFFESLQIDGKSISDCTEEMIGNGWSVKGSSIFLNGYNSSGITAKMNESATSTLQVVVVTDSTITDGMFGIYSNVGLNLTGMGEGGAMLHIAAGYVGINCSGLLEFHNGRFCVTCTGKGQALCAINQAHYLIETCTLAEDATVFVDWKATGSHDIYGLYGIANMTGSSWTAPMGRLSVSVENYGSGKACAQTIRSDHLASLKTRATVYDSDQQHFFVNMVGVDRLDLTVATPVTGAKPSNTVSVRQAGVTAELAYWIEGDKGVSMTEGETFQAGTKYTPRFLITLPDQYEYYPAEVKVTVNGKTAVFNRLQANNSQVITGVSFTTAQEEIAKTELKSISLTVPAPVAGQAPEFSTLSKTPNCTVQEVYWYNATYNTQVNEYQIFQAGETYEVRVFVQTSSGYCLDTGGDFQVTINGNTGKVDQVRGDSSALVSYTFPKLLNTAYTVTFAPNGGAGYMEPATVTRGGVYALPEGDFIPPQGKEFDQWDAGTPGEEIPVTGDMTITALWKDAAAKTEPVTITRQEIPLTGTAYASTQTVGWTGERGMFIETDKPCTDAD